jgi:hypothetical protein
MLPLVHHPPPLSLFEPSIGPARPGSLTLLEGWNEKRVEESVFVCTDSTKEDNGLCLHNPTKLWHDSRNSRRLGPTNIEKIDDIEKSSSHLQVTPLPPINLFKQNHKPELCGETIAVIETISSHLEVI